MEKIRKWSLMFTVTCAMYGWFSFADYAGARSGLRWKDISGAGVALWIFLIVGAVIILLQLVPAVLMFVSFLTGAYRPSTKAEATTDCLEVKNGRNESTVV